MPRKARAIYKGQYYHVITRGNNRQFLFRNDEDFQFYLQQLARYKEQYGVIIFHYCIMSNHVHLLVRNETSGPGISKMMQGLGMMYARYHKKKGKRTGHVFEDRFKSFHVQSDSYLLECGRYIERNPVRASMVQGAGDYLWSSYRHYAYGERNPLITENVLYKSLGVTPEERYEGYRNYVESERVYEKIVDQYFKERVLI